MRKIVEFGRYPVREGELREIEWIVLDEDEFGDALLISKNCIDSRQYEYRDNGNSNIAWWNSDIRAWLNIIFLDDYFTVNEKEIMQTIPIALADGRTLSDKVILLNAEEVEKYLPNEKDRKTKLSIWAKRYQESDGAYNRAYGEKGYAFWFLRDLSQSSHENWTCVKANGELDLVGSDIYRGVTLLGIRPVIKVNLDQLNDLKYIMSLSVEDRRKQKLNSISEMLIFSWLSEHEYLDDEWEWDRYSRLFTITNLHADDYDPNRIKRIKGRAVKVSIEYDGKRINVITYPHAGLKVSVKKKTVTVGEEMGKSLKALSDAIYQVS